MTTTPRRPRRAPLPARAAAPAALVCGLALVLGTAQPAAAHAGVSASEPRALARNVTVTFTSEAESAKAGIAKLQIGLPEGLSPAAVRLTKAPKGWQFTHSPGGYTIAGPPLATGKDAVHSIAVQQLPDAKQLVFRVVETYGDGQVSRWIEEPGAGGTSENPAPVLKLKPKAPDAVKVPIDPALVPTGTPSAAPKPSAPAGAPTATASPFPSGVPTDGGGPTAVAVNKETAETGDDDNGYGPLIGGAAAAALLLAAGLVVYRRRRSSGD
ncbi:DUF1775 domain-containing protein [Streptomyces qinzhouensis]|uniref:DUF1775 domain-containing protein n=1 Tax=Streptomyces qinzhouensis TaxID=2599401 RepID=A0A5B8JIE8_9ACTN|nr:DUF1775 domain-containing protein [Streptomyces qinzhouensis]QDY79631.1 DUF1775 domain-containing protein [Streptomyces qinzhouensis]